MHPPYAPSQRVCERALRTRGHLRCIRFLEPRRTALVVIDLQNYFVEAGAPGEIPGAREIVGTVDAMAHTLRQRGTTIAWIQTSSEHALRDWRTHHAQVLSPARAATRVAALAPGTHGFELCPGLHPHRDDLRVRKTHYSALIQGSSELERLLRERGIDTLLVTGAATNICCESTARDATMLGYRVAMVSDANATWTDEEHRSTLDDFACFFGDVVNAAEVLALAS